MLSTLIRSSLMAAAALAAPIVAQNATLTVVHGIPGLPEPVEVVADGNVLFTFDFPESRELSLPPNTYDIEVRLQGQTVLSAMPTLAADTNYTAVAHLQEGGGIDLGLFVNDLSSLADHRSRLIVRHLADAPAVDVLARRFWRFSRLVEDLSNGNEASADIRSGRYDVALTAAGSRTIAFGPAELDLEENFVYAVHAIGALGTDSFQLFLQAFDLNGAPAGLSATVSGTACGGAIASSTATPMFDTPFNVELSGAAADSFGFLHAGRSDSRLLFLRLPFDLSILGASGCTLYQSTEMIMPISTDAMGAASREFTIPSAMARDFQGIYFQYSFVNPGSNRLGLQLTELLSVEPAGN